MLNNEYIKVVFDLMKNQGLSFILLATMTYYFYTNLALLQAEIRECNSKVIEIYINDHREFRDLIRENNKIMDKIMKKID